jgi:hypothetical protein
VRRAFREGLRSLFVLLLIVDKMGVTREEIVPGTVLLVDTDHGVHGKHLGGDKDIVLVPQPSSDPEDPLNWTPKRKGLAIGMVFCYTLGVAISTAVQYSGKHIVDPSLHC